MENDQIIFSHLKNLFNEKTGELNYKISDINVKDDGGFTILHYSSLYNKIDDVKRILKLGADINVKNNPGWTPLHMSTIHGYKRMTKLLLEFGADPYIKNIQGETPIDLYENKEEILNYIRLVKLKNLYC